MEVRQKRILFGRRKGKPLRKSQQIAVDELLPELEVNLDCDQIDLAALFDGKVQEYWLEIGFGGGEHLAWQAEHHPEAGIIGCEPFLNGVAMMLMKLQESGVRNVRVHNEAAEPLMEKIADASLDKAFLLFADPWPKTSHHKRRFVTDKNITELARILKDDAILRIGTDHTDYGAWILHHFLRSDQFEWLAEKPQDWLVRGDDWPQTRYEAKAVREGRRSVYYRFRRVPRGS
ncbi:tRNA (guanosine(46)-N7)-methyltransferase TrmB [Sneathiella sp. P13V-1]|uniref:tRNA (guanine(46)-N(7))-methyltransferase TrmB n=1 Tax=Sneathiella sp. P13V-1 TaxID=2697366 RepID=UPI00187B839D|nr:tRNA (guanine(46)-N(7))-methyltransferase TrmB [Sneathiella sp. P13V-1]MBE7635860.1 tRNA (guanosine(46)-N7)-methyltransferase TrmB [Sneathiella sp. P13V-1]